MLNLKWLQYFECFRKNHLCTKFLMHSFTEMEGKSTKSKFGDFSWPSVCLSCVARLHGCCTAEGYLGKSAYRRSTPIINYTNTSASQVAHPKIIQFALCSSYLGLTIPLDHTSCFMLFSWMANLLSGLLSFEFYMHKS